MSGPNQFMSVSFFFLALVSCGLVAWGINDEMTLNEKCSPFVRETSFGSGSSRHVVCRDTDGGFQVRSVTP